MAKDLKKIKLRIKAVNQTLSITNAMYTTSVTKLSRASNNYKSYLEFNKNFLEIFYDMSKITDSIYLKENKKGKKIYFVITSDKGLCGSYHNDLFKVLNHKIETEKDIEIAVIGRKGYNYFNDKKQPLINKSYISNRDDINIIDYKSLLRLIKELYLKSEVREVYIVYNHSVNTMTREVKIEKLLPIEIDKYKDLETNIQYIYDEKPNKIFDDLVSIYLEQVLYGKISDSKLAEHEARMMAMKSASDNAKKVLEKLSILFNKARQEQITGELIDIVNASRR